MTRLQLAVIAVLSLVSTGLVLATGSNGGKLDYAALVADRRPVTVGGTPAAETSDGGEQVASADEDAAADVGSFDSGGGEAAPVETGGEVAGEGEDEGEGAGEGSGEETEAEEPVPTKIRHVFVIALAGHGYEATFGASSPARYLNDTLRPQGTLLDGYSTLGAAALADHLAVVGGQPPNADTRAGCPVFREIPLTTKVSRSGEIAVDGCVYPNTVATLGDQLTASRRPWRAYVEDLDRGPAGPAGPVTVCRRPASNAADDTLRARPGDGYATRHNPFVYFHSLLDLGDCDAKVGGLGQLESDLATARATPAFSYIVPNLCNGGTESPCVDGSPGGLAAADAWLATWAPRILGSPAYKADGLLVVAFMGSVDPAAVADAPVRNGALLVSRYAQAGGTSGSAYDPYSLLRAIEDLFALRPLARAAGAKSFAPTVLGRAYVEAPSDG